MSAAALLAVGAVPVHAADDNSAELRLRRAEAEIRALQRQVFPNGGDGKVFTAEINPATPGAGPAAAPATTPVTDLLTRMDAVEAQLARLTAQGEENAHRLAQLTTRMDALTPVAAATTPTVVLPPAITAAAPTASRTALITPVQAAATVTPSSARLAAVRAVIKPQSSDAGDDEYSYGYRLFDAKFYPEAQQQLQMFLTRYPRHTRVSYARNLLGRAYLEDGKSRDAATWFLQNYQAGKTGDRAPDSLLNLGEAMRRLSDTKRACIALSEFGETYPAEAAGRLKGQYDALRRGVTCN